MASAAHSSISLLFAQPSAMAVRHSSFRQLPLTTVWHSCLLHVSVGVPVWPPRGRRRPGPPRQSPPSIPAEPPGDCLRRRKGTF
jgi:hypothetical protein